MLEVRNLKTEFTNNEGTFLAVDDVSFSVKNGEVLGIVGESGCGKSVSALSIMGLVQSPGKIVGGEILLQDTNLLKLDTEQIRKLRGREMAMIFQEPMTSLNPVLTCGDQIDEALRVHHSDLSAKAIKQKSIELMKRVGIPDPENRYDAYPHQLSGGMRQRVMIAMALSCNPRLLIADEPTTALDVTIQAQILDLMRKLQQDLGTSLLLITHDLGVIAEMCDRVAVMYAGKIVEVGVVEDIFNNPQHPYTLGLLRSIPYFNSVGKKERLRAIPGLVPSMTNLPTGCRFRDRCFKAKSQCAEKIPALQAIGSDHQVACHFPLVEAEQKS